MDCRIFQQLKETVIKELHAEISDRMRARGLKFDQERFARQTSVDIEQLAIEILTFGCDVWPSDEEEPLCPTLTIAA